jgi:hypothetical protein
MKHLAWGKTIFSLLQVHNGKQLLHNNETNPLIRIHGIMIVVHASQQLTHYKWIIKSISHLWLCCWAMHKTKGVSLMD